jgi:hypothetical protein
MSGRERRERPGSARRDEPLPVLNFHVVFTLPPAAAEIAFQNKTLLYVLC